MITPHRLGRPTTGRSHVLRLHDPGSPGSSGVVRDGVPSTEESLDVFPVRNHLVLTFSPSPVSEHRYL